MVSVLAKIRRTNTKLRIEQNSTPFWCPNSNWCKRWNLYERVVNEAHNRGLESSMEKVVERLACCNNRGSCFCPPHILITMLVFNSVNWFKAFLYRISLGFSIYCKNIFEITSDDCRLSNTAIGCNEISWLLCHCIRNSGASRSSCPGRTSIWESFIDDGLNSSLIVQQSEQSAHNEQKHEDQVSPVQTPDYFAQTHPSLALTLEAFD